MVVPLDLADVTRARVDTPLIADLETMIPHLRASLDDVMTGVAPTLDYDDAEFEAVSDARGPSPAKTDGKRDVTTSASTSANTGVAHAAKSAAADMRVIRVSSSRHLAASPLTLDTAMAEDWLVRFIRDEMARRKFTCAVVGLSGGVDSAVTAFLAAKALGPENVIGVRLPYSASSKESLAHAQLVIDGLGIQSRTIDISAAVDGYLANEPDADDGRRGNVMARVRMIALFDMAAKLRGIPLGTGNKTERLFGYFTWHADDSPPINPLGDLFKTQVWDLARHLGVPSVVVSKPPTADLIVGQTDEGDFGISYAKADEILNWLLNGYTADELTARGFDAAEVAIVKKRVESTHWKRRLPTVAMLSATAIGESYLRPVDY